MVREALRGYLALVSGLTEVTAMRARAAAKALVDQGEATAEQVTALAEDLLATSRRNRESMGLLVRHEVEQAVRRLGLAASHDVEDLTRRVRELERAVREAKMTDAKPARSAPAARTRKSAGSPKSSA